MILADLSDAQILKIAESIVKDTIICARKSDWVWFSKYMAIEYSSQAVKQGKMLRGNGGRIPISPHLKMITCLRIIRKTEGVVVL